MRGAAALPDRFTARMTGRAGGAVTLPYRGVSGSSDFRWYDI